MSRNDVEREKREFAVKWGPAGRLIGIPIK